MVYLSGTAIPGAAEALRKLCPTATSRCPAGAAAWATGNDGGSGDSGLSLDAVRPAISQLEHHG